MELERIEKKNGESQLEYHKRLVYGKLVDKTLSDIDYSELSEYVYGKEYSSDVARRMMYGSKNTLDIIGDEMCSSLSDTDMLKELDRKKIELQKERQKYLDQRAAFNKDVRDRSRQEELNEIIENAVMYGDLPELNYEFMEIEHSDSDMLVSLNDIHYGLDISNAWGSYNPEVCASMMRDYLDQIISIKNRHGCENCIVWMNGDAISGRIHLTIQLANRENAIEQVKGVSELTAEFLAELSKHFRSVKFISVAGNHSRLDTKDNSPNNERLDDLVEWYLKARLQNFDNVDIITEKLDGTMYAVNIRGNVYVGVHGDYGEQNASTIASIQAMVNQPVYAVLSGHLHHNKIDIVNGVKTVMAGSFVGTDDYCIKKRIYSRPEQLVCICDNSGICCYYDINLGW